MNATSVASSGQMFSSLSQKTQGSSQAFNPFASRPAGDEASFGLDGAGDSKWEKRTKRKNRFLENSDGEGIFKINNPFKTKDASLSSDGGRQRKKRGGDGDRKGTEARKNPNPNPKKTRDDANKPRPRNGHGVNGVNGVQPAAASAEDDESRPTSSSSMSSAGGDYDASLLSAQTYAKKVYDRLRKDGINPPSWPDQPGSPESKAEMSKFREKYEEYRKKVRASLTKAGLIDDPEKRKTLQDAITFRGICEDMCPEYEKITRITEHDVPQHERLRRTNVANPKRMVKKLARSAAGQEAPLPMDVRSTASLRRTLDYLIDDLLRNDDNLPGLHGFLWDRTRAIRRDFTFFSSLTAEDLKTQAYVLENVARFHVTSLHLLSQPGKAGEDFVEQQELEQLGKALLSLRDLYDDCNAQGITCENEAEFRAYHLVFHAHDPSTTEMLQRQWKPHFWSDSDEIRTAMSLAEALQNTMDFHGPLKVGPSLAASSALYSFFRIVESVDVSYTMACFAECHFPQLRRSILKAVKRAMARPKESTNDVTAQTLNKYLRFDTVQEAIDFAKVHNMEFVPDEQAPMDAGRQILVLNNKAALPRPRLQHQFSQSLVEKKRGSRRLPEVIHQTVHEAYEASKRETNGVCLEAEESLFVQDSEPETTAVDSLPMATKPTPPSGRFDFLGQSRSGFASMLADPGFQAAPKPQPPAPKPNPFATKLSTPSGGTTTLANPFATPSQSSDTTSATNKFAPSTSLGNSTSSLSAPATVAGSSTQPTPAAPLTGLQGQEPTKPHIRSEQPNPFSLVPQLGINGNPPQAKSPLSAAGTPGQIKPVASNPFATILQGSSDNKLPAPNTTTIGTQNGVTQPVSNPFAPFILGPGQTNAKDPSSSSNVIGNTLSPDKGPSSLSSGQALGLGSAASPTGPLLPTFGTGSTSQPLPSLTQQPLAPLGGTVSSPFSGILGLKPTADAKLGSLSSGSPLAAEKKPEAQPRAPSQGNILPPQPSLSSINVGLGASSAFNPSGAGSSTVTACTSSQLAKPSPEVTTPPRDLLGDFTKWFVKGDNGLMHEFEIFIVDSILQDVYKKFRKDEAERKRKEEEERDNAEAKRFRVYNLSLKFFYRWKRNAREKRLSHVRRTGREQLRAFHEAQRAARLREEQEAAQRAAQRKAELAAQNHAEELSNRLRTSRRAKRRAEDDLLASGVLAGVGNERETVATIVHTERNPSPSSSSIGTRSTRSRPGSTTGARESSKTRALREELLGGKPGRFRRSLPSMTSEGSSPDRTIPRVSRVSERWRLKAMGIVQMPDGTALPESMANEIRLGLKKDFERETSRTVRRASITGGATRTGGRSASNAPARADAGAAVAGMSSATNKRKRPADDNGDGDGDGAAKGDASQTTPHKRVLSEAENLIQELRGMREEMEEGVTWFKEQNGRLQSEILSRGGTPLNESSI